MAIGTAGGGRARRARRSARYLVLSLVLHLAVIAAAAWLFAAPPVEAPPIEVAIVLDTGESEAGARAGAGQQSAEHTAADQPAARQPEVTPRPNPKPAAPARPTEVKKIAAPPSPPKVKPKPTPEVRPTAAPPRDSSPVAQAAPSSALDSAQHAADAGATGGGIANAAAGGGQQAGTASGGGGGTGKAAGGGRAGAGASDYLERVRAALARHKRYPDEARKLKQEGTVSISLHIARDGTVLAAQIAKPSGSAFLDEAALQMARDASPLPRVPDDVEGDSVRIALPVSFSLGFFGRFQECVDERDQVPPS